MTADALGRMLAQLPKDQRKPAGDRVVKFEARYWQDIRIFDRFPIDAPEIHDLIGTDPTSGDTEFLVDHLTPRG